MAPAAPTALKISYSGPIVRSDALSFTFAESPREGDTWNVLENGVPIAVNTRYYEGLDTDTWKTEIPALPFQPGDQPWDVAKNPVFLPTSYGLRGLTAGNLYEIQMNRGGASSTSQPMYGRFRGASADGVGETMTGTVALLDLDYGTKPPAGVG
ncbi:MAG: hypothetical protein EBR23_01595, partial [Planctomycetia bacterium]|nr:hypothetical protein [Planctomycetia bacterium]